MLQCKLLQLTASLLTCLTLPPSASGATTRRRQAVLVSPSPSSHPHAPAHGTRAAYEPALHASARAPGALPPPPLPAPSLPVPLHSSPPQTPARRFSSCVARPSTPR